MQKTSETPFLRCASNVLLWFYVIAIMRMPVVYSANQEMKIDFFFFTFFYFFFFFTVISFYLFRKIQGVCASFSEHEIVEDTLFCGRVKLL